MTEEPSKEPIKKPKCPKCGADLICGTVFVMCSNFQDPHFQRYFNEGGKRNCDYAIMCG